MPDQTGAAIEALGAESRTFPPPADFAAQALTSDSFALRRGRRRPAWRSGRGRPASC